MTTAATNSGKNGHNNSNIHRKEISIIENIAVKSPQWDYQTYGMLEVDRSRQQSCSVNKIKHFSKHNLLET